LYRFRTVETSEDIKEFLEEYSGDGTVVSVDVDQTISEGSRTKAKVQFTTSEAAQKVKLRSYLKVRDMDYDIVPTRMAAEYTIDNITLHFGCQVSKEKFYALWNKENVSVKFGFGNRKIYLFLTYLSTKYKLELSYENIWQIELHRPLGQAKKFLIVQV
jgi:RNA-dependent RNA polymerase